MRIALKNSENDIEISFKTMKNEDEEVDNIQVRFFFFSHNVLNPDIITLSGY